MQTDDRDRRGITAATADLGRRVAVGSLLVGVRSVLIQIVALAGTIVIARHLSPRDLGVLAVGFTIASFASVMADGGLAAGLIRGARPPSARDLRVALGLQLAAMAAFLAVAAIAVSPFAGIRAVTFLILIALPLTAVQTPAKVILERDLDYRRVAIIEVSEYAVYYAWAAGAVLMGYGVWGVASASIVRALAASTLALVLVPSARTLPAWSWQESRGLLRFGVGFQAVNVTNLLRDQAINIATAALAGTSALGIWTLASRMLQAPTLLFSTLWRVSYPAMSKFLAIGKEPRELLERASGLTALVTGAMLSTVAAVVPALVPTLFGTAWQDAAWVVLPACLALMIGGPVSVAAAGYLYAIGDTKSVLRSAILHTIAWLGVALLLLPVLGAPGVGLAWIAGSIVDAVVLGRAAHRACGARLFRSLRVPLLVAVPSSLAGWILARVVPPSLGIAAAAGVLALSLYSAGVWVAAKQGASSTPIADLRALLRRVKNLRSGRPRVTVQVTPEGRA